MSNTKKLAENTILAYTARLKYQKKHNIVINSIDDVDAAIVFFNKNKIPYNTQKQHLSAMDYDIKNRIRENPEIENEFMPIVKEISRQVNVIRGFLHLFKKGRTLTESEMSKYIKWSDVQKVHESAKNQVNNDGVNGRLQEYYLVLSLYVVVPPRRIKDYSEMFIGNLEIPSDKNCILWSNTCNILKYGRMYMTFKDNDLYKNVDKTKNYYSKIDNNAFFIFFNYKTASTYNYQIIEVPDELRSVVNNYIALNGLGIGDKLLSYNNDGLKNLIKYLFKSAVDVNMGASMLRHSYINYVFANDNLFDDHEKYIVSNKMAHSELTQKDYVIKDSNLDKTVDTVKDLRLKKKYTSVKNMTEDQAKEHRKKQQKVSRQKKNKKPK